MNNKGQVILFAFMLCVIIIVLAMGISFAVRQGSTNAYNAMNCTNMSALNDSTVAGCYVTDVTPAVFIGILIAIAGMVLVGRFVFG